MARPGGEGGGGQQARQGTPWGAQLRWQLAAAQLAAARLAAAEAERQRALAELVFVVLAEARARAAREVERLTLAVAARQSSVTKGLLAIMRGMKPCAPYLVAPVRTWGSKP